MLVSKTILTTVQSQLQIHSIILLLYYGQRQIIFKIQKRLLTLWASKFHPFCILLVGVTECIRCVTVSLCRIPPVTISHFHSCGFLYFVQVYDWGGYTFKILHKYTIRIWIVWQYEEHVFFLCLSLSLLQQRFQIDAMWPGLKL